MTKDRGEVYKCNVCGNIVELLYVGGGQLVCCGQPMEWNGDWPSVKFANLTYVGYLCLACRTFIRVLKDENTRVDWVA